MTATKTVPLKYCAKSASVTSDKVVAIGTGKRTEG